MSDAAEVTVVICTYQAKDVVGPCLDSLRDQTDVKYKVVVADNASQDGTEGFVRANYPEARVIQTGWNAGFAVATNAGIRVATTPLVLVLNPDVRVPAGALRQAIETAATFPRAAFVGCRLERSDGTFDHASKRTFPTPVASAVYLIPLLRDLPVLRRWNSYVALAKRPDVTEPVDAINGAFMLARVDALEAIGLLDESYWMYGEDLDWCKRAWDAGWTVQYIAEPTVTHLKGAIAGTPRKLRTNYWFHKAMWLFYIRHGRPNPVGRVAVGGAIGVRLTGTTALSIVVHSWRRLRAASARRADAR